MLLPVNIDFYNWACQIRIDLPNINFPNPQKDEKNWQDWACQVVQDNSLSYVPVPSKQIFKDPQDWKVWAAYFIKSVYIINHRATVLKPFLKENQMYDTDQHLPSPYQLAAPAYNGYSFKRGGKVRSKKMTLAHFNPHELNVLDHLQGKETRGRDGVRSYDHLEELLSNPHIINHVHNHVKKHFASGGQLTYGSPELQHLAQSGRNGDSEIAAIGPRTQRLFDGVLGHTPLNPYTGHPEYWSLGGALGGLWNGIKSGASNLYDQARNYDWGGAAKGVAQAALPAMMPMAQQALGGRFGAAGQFAGQMLPNVANAVLGSGQGNQAQQSLGEGLGKYAQGLQGGLSGREALGHSMQHVGGRLGGGLGAGMQNAGQAFSQNQGLGEAARAGASGTFNSMGGINGLASSAKNVVNAYGQDGGMQRAAQNEMLNYGQKAQPSYQSFIPQAPKYNPQAMIPSNQTEEYQPNPYDRYGNQG